MIDAARHPLLSGEGALALELALAQPDPGSLTAATKLRARVSSELAALALEQASLRAKARVKFGDQAGRFLYTAVGLEQATRPEVSRERVAVVAPGVGARTRVVDVGCGLGFDALAFANAGAQLTAVERDPLTASCARHNLATAATATPARVILERAEALVDDLVTDESTIIFADPARRSAQGRSWQLSDLSPSWEFVLSLRARGRLVVKLGPGAPLSGLPDDLARLWLSHRGSLVELCLYEPPVEGGCPPEMVSVLGSEAGDHAREATITTVISTGAPPPPVGPLARLVHEPDPGIVRSRLFAEAAGGAVGVRRLADSIAYLTSDQPLPGQLFANFEVMASLPWSLKNLRAWCREHEIGTLEIKKRGVDVDPAELRRALKLRGSGAATVIITPTQAGVRAILCNRV